MRYAYFPGCKIPHHLPAYGAATQAVCAALDIELVPLEFNCCGWPHRDESYLASMYAAARNLALAAEDGLDILTPCKCCFGQLKQAQARIGSNPGLARELEGLLSAEGLQPGQPRVLHLLTVLDQKAADWVLQGRVRQPLRGLKVACHYGCHALRPAHVTGFADPLNPAIFERVIEALGAEPLAWDLRLECCGHPLRDRDEVISESLMRRKLKNAQSAGADVVATACTYCQMQFETEREGLRPGDELHEAPRALLVSQLAARALGLE